MLDLSAIPIIDNHCHPFLRATFELTTTRFRALFTEARHDGRETAFVGSSVYYRWALKELGRILGCSATEDAILGCREAYSPGEYIALLFGEAGIDTLLLDTGLGGPEFLGLEEMSALTGCRTEWVLRLEVLAQELILTTITFEDFVARLDQALQNLRGQGVVSLKSIAAYRSGLQLEQPNDRDVARAYAEARLEAQVNGRIRITNKLLVDYVVYAGMAHAAEEQLPIQFHTGYGDPDTDLRLGNPLHLRCLFEDSRFEGVPIVLLHESYPFTREAAFLAAVYPNAYLDISYSVPFLDYHELFNCTQQALGTASWEKILYSSDGFSIPEHSWLGAIHGRQVLGAALHEKVAVGELTSDEAYEAAHAILHGNSRRVYRL